MVLKLYGNQHSTNAQRVAFVLNEKNVPFEFVPVDFAKGEHKSEATLRYQPFGAVPYIIEDDGFVLYESRAICRYIATKYANQGTPLLPADLKKSALAEQAIQVETSRYEAAVGPYMIEKWLKPFLGGQPNEQVAAEMRKKLAETLDVYEKILSKQKYLGGEELTLGDLYHVPWGVLLPTVGCDELQTRPHVAKWFNELKDRPAWQAAQAFKSTAASS
ncbi:hypothetical protein VTO42DRAFT_7196 [Malbranchea cinnamomea]